jgi:phosphate transport system substrate-binding protein
MEHRADQNLMLRLYDVTDRTVLPDQYEQFDVDDLALSCDVPIAHSNRSYVVELGYADPQSHWTPLARSSSVWMPA